MVGPRSSKPLYGGSIPSSLAPLRLGLTSHMASLLSSSRFLQLVGAFRCGTCLLVIGAQNPVHSLLLLIRVFALGTLLLFTLHREYFALLFLIVYVGAIVVLFLFVIRRLEIKRVNVTRRLRDLFAPRHLIVGVLLLEILLLASADAFDLSPFISSVAPAMVEGNVRTDWSALLHRTDPLRALGGLLFTEYATTLLLAALLLTLARVGAIGLSLLPDPLTAAQIAGTTPLPHTTLKGQDPNNQARRHPALATAVWRSARNN